ncbi:MAG: class I SAM-dependent methyltransferase [Actinobacteria bacterium]|nr:class I SAM-dependent methyltransferase [Actinomycetota bacterium]
MAAHPIHALLYDPVMGLADRAGLGARRRRLVAEARGRVLEVGGGTGLNLPLYRDVEAVVVLEPDSSMRRRLLHRLATAAVPVEVHETTIEESGLPDGSFDTVVATLVLCSVADQGRALGEIRRLLGPGGRLLFLEHVRASGWLGRAQAVATPFWSRLAAGCHLDRPTLGAIRAAGLAITDCDRWGVFVQGVARPAHRRAGVAA